MIPKPCQNRQTRKIWRLYKRKEQIALLRFDGPSYKSKSFSEWQSSRILKQEKGVGMAKIFKFLSSLVLSLLIAFNVCSCSSPATSLGSLDPNGSSIGQDTISENTIQETTLKQVISTEIYLKEIVIAENQISELLIKEDKVEEVLLCKTIYVPQENIEDFSKNSLTGQLFGSSVDIRSLLTKIAIGTGVIITLTVLSIAGLEGPAGSIVAAAAPAALKAAAVGAGIGTLLGGLTGAADSIDESRRTSAIIGFAAAVAGLIVATVSVIAAIPSGGGTTITAALGVKLFLAGVSLIGTIYAGYNAIKTYTTTDATNIDWNNIDWKKAGESAAKESIQGAANGYMWGSIIGAVSGGAEGLDFYNKFGAPYSQYNARLVQTPKDGSGGHWDGDRGESKFILDKPITCSNGTKVSEITYHNAIPDFSPYAKAQVDIPTMTNNRADNFRYGDEILAKYWSKIGFEGKTWSARDISLYRSENGLTWHEMNNMKSMQLVPTEINATWSHLGGVGEYNSMIRQEGGDYFD